MDVTRIKRRREKISEKTSAKDADYNAILTQEEKIIYRGIGSLIYYAAQDCESDCRIVMGPVFTTNMYLYIRLNKTGRSIDWLPSVVSEISNQALEQAVVKTLVCDDVEYLNSMDPSSQENFSMWLDFIDDTKDWSSGWNETLWEQAKTLLCTNFEDVMYKQYIFVYNHVAQGIFEPFHSIPDTGSTKVDCRCVTVMSGHENMVKLSASASCDDESFAPKLGVKLLIIAGIYRYLTSSHTGIFRVESKRDEAGYPWKAKVEFRNIHSIKYINSRDITYRVHGNALKRVCRES